MPSKHEKRCWARLACSVQRVIRCWESVIKDASLASLNTYNTWFSLSIFRDCNPWSIFTDAQSMIYFSECTYICLERSAGILWLIIYYRVRYHLSFPSEILVKNPSIWLKKYTVLWQLFTFFLGIVKRNIKYCHLPSSITSHFSFSNLFTVIKSVPNILVQLFPIFHSFAINLRGIVP